MRAAPTELPSHMFDARQFVGKHVAASGRFLPQHTIYLDNKLRRGRPGYEVVMPLRLNGVHVLVNRGWVAAGRTRDALPEVPTPPGAVRVAGLALERLPQVLEPGSGTSAAVRQNLDTQAYARETGLQLQPIVIEQHSPAADGLARDWPRPDAGAEKNQAYALQWYSLAGLALVLFVVLSFRRVGAH